MALENVMRVDGGHIVTGGGAGGNSVEIDWKDWCELTPEEQETGDWTIVNCPWADGYVSVDLMTKLWENPSQSSNFPGQDILLDLTSFDMVYIQGSDSSCIVSKGISNRLQRVENADATSKSTGTLGIWRSVYVTDSYVSFGDCKSVFTTRAVYTSNNYCRPYQIYGIKLTATVKINAIAMDVSTSANKCMLSDGETSVEDRLDANTFGTTVNITSYDSSSNTYIFPSDGYVTISATAASSKIIYQIPEGPAISAIYNTQHAWNSVFVKKGMHGFVYSKSGTVNAYFKPLTY